MAVTPDLTLRRATVEDAPAVAEVWLRSRRAAAPAIPASIHGDDDVRRWVAEVLIPEGRTWVAADAGDVVAMMSLREGWIDQLYVDPSHQGRGVGTLLVQIAQEQHPEALDLWTFQANEGARRFYERHGFTVVEMTDGDNEEGAPDVRYHWKGQQAQQGASSSPSPRTN